MKPTLLFLSLFCLMLVSCSKETAPPTEPVAADTTVGAALSVTRIDDSTAEVSWDAAVPGATSVVISWQPAENPAARDSAQLSAAASSTRLTGLDSTRDYTILLTSRKADGDVVLMHGALARVPVSVPPPATPDGLLASSLSSNSVALRWNASATPGATYLVTYRKWGGSDTSSSATPGTNITVSGTTAMIANLTPGAHTFHVFALREGSISGSVSILWAAAERFTQDAEDPSTTLRMYEFAASKGSGLILDPGKGGPRNVSLSPGSSTPQGSVALAIYTGAEVPASTFDIGPPYAFPGFRNSNHFDSSAYISRDAFTVSSLGDLFLSKSLDTYISGGGFDAGNISAFNFPVIAPDGKSIAFLMRIGNTGTGSGTHFARVLVKADESGRLMRGSAPNRYVEVEISYQSVTNLPFAKGARRSDPTPDYRSRVPFPLQ